MDFGYNDIKNPGLKKRRDYERQLFQTPMIVPKRYKGGQLIKIINNTNIMNIVTRNKCDDNYQLICAKKGTKLIPN